MRSSRGLLQTMLAGPGGVQEERLARRLDLQERERQLERERNRIWLRDQQQHWRPEAAQIPIA